MADVARRKELPYRVYVEREGHVGEVQRLFGVQWVPTLVLLDRQGRHAGVGVPAIRALDELLPLVADR